MIGPNANRSVIQGGGSARVTPAYSITPLSGIIENAEMNNMEVHYEKGVENHPAVPLMEKYSLKTNEEKLYQNTPHQYFHAYLT